MKKKTVECNLKTCFLCKNVMETWLPAVGAHKKNLRFKKGEMIFEEGKPVRGIYFLFEGKVKVHKNWGDQKQLILRFAQAGDMIGYRGLGNEKVYPVTTTALEPVVVCFIDLAFFDTTLQVNHQFTFQLMKFYADELQQAEKRMSNLAHMEVKGRLAETLLLLQKKFGKSRDGHINILLSRQDIASFTGTTYETLFRTMTMLIKEKLIKIQGKKIFILKEDKLEALKSS